MANFLKSFFPPFLHSNPNIFVVVSIVFTLLLIENVDAYVADFLVEFNTSLMGIILFTIITGGYLVGQFFLLKFIRSNSRAIKSRSRLIAKLGECCCNSTIHTGCERNRFNYSGNSIGKLFYHVFDFRYLCK
jgi:hypothetical protein